MNKRIAEIREKYKDTPRKKGAINKGAVSISILMDQISRLRLPEDEYIHPEPGVELKFHSKYIERIDMIFRGPGIKELDKYEEIIKRRIVRLRRYELTEDFSG